MLHYTGHPLIDVGVATITAMSEKNTPQAVNEKDLEIAAQELMTYYVGHKGFSAVLATFDLFKNAGYRQPKFTHERKLEAATKAIYAFLQDRPHTKDSLACVFFPELQALDEPAHRQHIPLLNGADIGNFSPIGRAGLPISGLAMLAIHAMPLGCYKCGHLLAFHETVNLNDPNSGRVMLMLARKALEGNRNGIMQAALGDVESAFPSFGSYFKTRYVEQVLKAALEIERRTDDERIIQNLTGYYFSNYGPAPSLQIVRLSNTVFDFIAAAQHDQKDAWRRVVGMSWQAQKPTKGEIPAANIDEVSSGTEVRRNTIYELLFDLPYKNRVFLGHLKKSGSWQLIELFLRKVMMMEQSRIDTYRALGDKLAQYALDYENQPQSFYIQFSRAAKYDDLRSKIRSAAEKVLRRGTEQPLLTYDEFMIAFEHPSDSYSQWKLGRDLIAIRMLEVLQKHKVDLQGLPDEISEDNEE